MVRLSPDGDSYGLALVQQIYLQLISPCLTVGWVFLHEGMGCFNFSGVANEMCNQHSTSRLLLLSWKKAIDEAAGDIWVQDIALRNFCRGISGQGLLSLNNYNHPWVKYDYNHWNAFLLIDKTIMKHN